LFKDFDLIVGKDRGDVDKFRHNLLPFLWLKTNLVSGARILDHLVKCLCLVHIISLAPKNTKAYHGIDVDLSTVLSTW
jgi:hypothetical protein